MLTYALLALLIFPLQAPKANLSHTTSFVVFPQDSNANPPMAFGGKLLAEMDRTAGITVRRFLYQSPLKARDAVTVSIRDLDFKKSAQVKDLLFVTGTVVETGTKSITMRVKVERELADETRELLLEGTFVFCSYDLTSKTAIPHGLVVVKPPLP